MPSAMSCRRAATCGLVALCAFLPSAAQAIDYGEKRLLEGVVRLKVTRIGGVSDVGAGIIVGVEGTTAYVLTALHVLVGPENERNASGWERRTDEISVLVEFYDDPTPLRGNILGRWNELQDLAVVLVDDRRIAERGVAVAYGTGSPETLAAPYPAVVIGHGGQEDWGRQTTRVTSVSDSLIRVRGAGIIPGFSGGALLDTTRDLLIGMMTAVSTNGGEAVSIDHIVSNLDSWRVPHHLRRAGLSTPMVRVPAGSFVMRANPSSGALDREKEIYLDAYFIDKYEVTVGDFRRFVEETSYPYRPGVSTCNFADINRDAFPMNCVTWIDANAFAKWAGKELPTEAQWEKAARGTKGYPYPWGKTPPRPGDVALRLDWPVQVGSHPRDRSPYGAMDMLGNVSEWVADWYQRGHVQFLAARNPKGPPSGQDRVIRGASYDTPPASTNLTLRKRDLQEFGRMRFDYGLRCVLNEVRNGE